MLTLAGFILAMDFGSGIEKEHRRIGIAVFSGMLVQVAIVWFRPHPNTKWRWLFNWQHWWLGRILAILAIVNVFKGLNILEPGHDYEVLAAFFVGLIAGLFVVLQVLNWTTGKPEVPESSSIVREGTATSGKVRPQDAPMQRGGSLPAGAHHSTTFNNPTYDPGFKSGDVVDFSTDA